MDENRWRRYNWSGKFINEPPLPNWWNNASEGKNISQNFPRMVWGPAFVGKWILATRRSKERHLFYQVTQLWKRFPMEEGDAIKANGCLCLLARTRWKLQKKKQFFSREVVPDFHWMRIVYISILEEMFTLKSESYGLAKQKPLFLSDPGPIIVYPCH